MLNESCRRPQRWAYSVAGYELTVKLGIGVYGIHMMHTILPK